MGDNVIAGRNPGGGFFKFIRNFLNGDSIWK